MLLSDGDAGNCPVSICSACIMLTLAFHSREFCITLNNEEYVKEALLEAEQYGTVDVVQKTKEAVASVSKGIICVQIFV